MKNGLLVWNVLLTLVAGFLLITYFNSGKKGTTGTKAVVNDSPDNSKGFRIAYFEMDSVEANFSLVKDVKSELSKKEDAINSEMDRLSKNFQQKYYYYQNQAQGGTMTQAQSESASQELKTLDDQLKSRKQALDQEYSNLVMDKMKDVKTKIKDFLKEYNKTKNYTYIASYGEADGLFYYKDTAYNITNDVIKGLNEMYKIKKN